MRYLILIVDDDPDAAARVAKIVEVLIKCSTERAADREEAFLKLRTTKYDAVIADLNMGGVFEGELLLEAMKTYFTVPPGTIIVSVTGGETSARNLKGRFPFIKDVFAKDDIEKVTGTLRVALEEAVKTKSVVSETNASNTVKPPSDWKVRLWVAIIGGIVAIIVAVIRACSG